MSTTPTDRSTDDRNGPVPAAPRGTERPDPDSGGSGTGDPQNGAQGASGSAGTQPRDAAGRGSGTDPDGTGDDGGNPEAARFRRRLRDTERERDRLAEQVQRMQTADVARVAADTLAEGGDLLALGGTTLPDLLDDDGNVDPDAVRSAAAELVRARPGLRRGPTGAEVRNGIGQGSGPAPRTGGSGSGGWSEALRPR